MELATEMALITLSQYYMGRDLKFPGQLSKELRNNAGITVTRANTLLGLAESQGVTLELHPVNGSLVSSGWRPPAINTATPGAALRSKHMTCQAIDIYDPDGDLDDWCLAHLSALETAQLWLEHPSATKGWCHLQIIPPRSGRRVFYP